MSGWAVILFADRTDSNEECVMSHCPMSVDLFDTRGLAEAFAERSPEWTNAHILPIART